MSALKGLRWGLLVGVVVLAAFSSQAQGNEVNTAEHVVIAGGDAGTTTLHVMPGMPVEVLEHVEVPDAATATLPAVQHVLGMTTSENAFGTNERKQLVEATTDASSADNLPAVQWVGSGVKVTVGDTNVVSTPSNPMVVGPIDDAADPTKPTSTSSSGDKSTSGASLGQSSISDKPVIKRTKKDTLSAGALAGIIIGSVIGGCLLLAVCGCAGLFLYKKRQATARPMDGSQASMPDPKDVEQAKEYSTSSNKGSRNHPPVPTALPKKLPGSPRGPNPTAQAKDPYSV